MQPLLIIPLIAVLLPPTRAQCLFNHTHCACALSTSPPGLCTRFSSGTASSATCFVDNCRPDTYVCDCSATSLCHINACDSWRATNPAHVTTVGDLVPCAFQPASATCIQPTRSIPAAVSPSLAPSPTATPVQSPRPSPPPHQYRMVQFGAASDASMFNMTAFTDVGDFITTTFDMRNKWPEKNRLEHRWHTVMLYQSDAATDRFLCYIINTYDAGDDFMGTMEAFATVTASDGQTMSWAACDDALDSCQTASGNVVSSFFANEADVTGGFCVKPVDFSGNAFTIQLTDVRLARGVRFINPAGTVNEFLWSDGATNGMMGSVNANGLVTLGATPVITINLAGLLVP